LQNHDESNIDNTLLEWYQKFKEKEKSKEKIISEIDNFINQFYKLKVTTFHAFCNNIIDEYSIEIGVTQDPYIENNIDNFYKDVIDNLWIDDFLNLNHELISAVNKKKISSRFGSRINKSFFVEILKNIDDCYKTLGIIHKEYNCIPGKFKDYISSPKINGYKSIHTAVIGSNKKPIEIQIRTTEMHDFAERGIASHWQYKSSEKFNSLTWKEYDWLKDLVEIIEKNENPEHSYEYTKLQMFQENVFCFTPKGSVIKLPKDATPIDFAYAVHTKIGDTAIGCEINGNKSELQTILRNGDRVKIITSKNHSPSLHWIPITKTGKARAAIRRYWHEKGERKEERVKKYNTTLWISLPDKPGQLGNVSSLIGEHKLNISNLVMAGKNPNYINFKFQLIIRDLKNFTNFIAELKQKGIKFKIIRHEDKRNAFTQKILRYFKKN